MVAEGDLTTAEASEGLSRLDIPFGVSGMANSKRLNQAAKMLNLKGVRVFRTSATSVSDPSSPLVPGGNLGASISYGDVTAAGVGTVTAVCGDEILAFGHPMLWNGRSQLTMHNADAIYVQEDPTFSGFKVANLTGPVGSILEDRLAGLHGLNGAIPDTTAVTSHVESTEGGARDGITNVSVEDWVPDISAIHLLSNEDRVFDQIGPGSARVRWTVEGVRSDGQPFEYSRVNKYANQYDITYSTIFESYEQLWRLINNKFVDVTITDVSYRSLVDPEYRAYRLARVERRIDGQRVTLKNHDRITVHHGTTLELRVLPKRVQALGEQTVRFSMDVPDGNRQTYGTLQIVGGNSIYERYSAQSFADLIDQLANGVHNNDVVSSLWLGRHRGRAQVSTETVDEVVSGSFYNSLRVK